MSTSPIPVQSRLLLPRVQIILSEINQFVYSTRKLYDEDDIWSHSEAEADDCCEDISLEWDNNNYYKLYYYNTSVEDGDYASASSRSDPGGYANLCSEDDFDMSPELEAEYKRSPEMEAEYERSPKLKAEYKKSSMKEEDMMTKILHSMMLLAPNLIYLRSKSQRSRIWRMKKTIHSELSQIWKNVFDIVQPPASSIKGMPGQPQLPLPNC